MTFRSGCLAVMLVLSLAPAARAQVDVGLVATGLISIQPVNDWAGGAPYLDEGIGGWTPGMSIGVAAVAPNGFTVLADFAAIKTFEKLQHGRLIYTRTDAFHSGTSNTRFRDTIVSALAGRTLTIPRGRLLVAAGVGFVKTAVTEDAISLEQLAGDEFTSHRILALAGGADYYRAFDTRVSLVVGGRYFLIDRSRAAEEIGIGRHVIRIAAGLRVRMN